MTSLLIALILNAMYLHRPSFSYLPLLLSLLLAACSGRETPVDTAAVLSGDPAADLYTCPMHPSIIRHAPGQCPVCGMTLVRKVVSGPTADTAAAGPTAVVAGPGVARGQLVHPMRQTVAADITAPGTISYDPRRVQNVAARFGGRIERLYVRYQFQPVRAGQKLYDIYSPELVTEQQNLLFLLAHAPADPALLTASRRKLRLLGLTASQLRAIEQSRRPQLRLSVFSPTNGYVLAPGSMAATAAGPLEQTAALPVREGDYVTMGQTLFQVVNTERVWALLQLYPASVAAVRVGQAVDIQLADQPQAPPRAGTVAYLEPMVESATSTVTARVYLPNPGGQLQIGQLVTGRIRVPAAAGLWVPATAVVDLGTRQVVFQQVGGQLAPVAVAAGSHRADQVQILRGLTAADLIARDAQYLTDSDELITPVAE